MSFAAIADFVLGEPAIPETALDMAATLLIDTLGVAAGAAPLASGRIARDHAARFLAAPDGPDSAPLLFDGRRASIPGAAFALASQIDNLDAHDGLNPTKGHIGCAVVPALCAFAEANPALTGPDGLRAMVIAYEVAARAAMALHASVAEYHTSGAWNALGVAALGVRLRGGGAQSLRHALGIAEYHGPRSQMMREIAHPSMLHDGSGQGALAGAMAALLALDGFTGAPAITLEAPEAQPIWADLGSDWSIARNYIKPWPVCRWAHGALAALEALMRAHDPRPEKVARIEVNTFAESAALFAGMPQTTSQAQYSLPFALAALLINRRLGRDEISGPSLRDPRVAALLERIEVRESPRHSARFPEGRWSDVTVTLKDGTCLRSGDVNARGGPEAPLQMAEIKAKFHAMAGDLPAPRRKAIWAMRARLTAPDCMFSQLTQLLQAAP